MAEVERFAVKLSNGVSLEITDSSGTKSWVKPAVETQISWKGVPDEESLELAITHLAKTNDSVVGDTIRAAYAKLQK